MKLWQTKKKLVYLFILFIIIFSVAIISPIILIKSKNNENKQSTDSKQIKPIVNTSLSFVETIKNKIEDNYLVINKDIDTSSPKLLLQVVKKQLKKQNPQLTVADLAKITLPADFTPILGVKNRVNLIITAISSQDENGETILKEIFLKKQRELLANSQITDGESGFIFQDQDGNLWALGSGTKLQVLKKGATSWTDDQTQEPLLKGSKIEDGWLGFIFQDQDGNLWALGSNTPLQVLKRTRNGYASSWTDDVTTESLLKNSNIIDGESGFIFQDRQGNLWAVGFGKPLQVLKRIGDKYADSWTADTSQDLTKGSKIEDGSGGFIFQDQDGNLWTLGSGTPLQVLTRTRKGYATSWTTDTSQEGLTKGSKLRDGRDGFIFQDQDGNLWALGSGTPLQVLKRTRKGYVTSWTDDPTTEPLLKDSKITNGSGGFIFQDQDGNLWALGRNTKLQVLKRLGDKYADSWTDDENQGLTKGSKIRDGRNGFIFQDHQGNLWALGSHTSLQVLKKGATSWTDDQTQEPLLKNSQIRNGYGGFIFQDDQGNLWALGYDTSLRVLRKDSDGWES